MPSEGIAAKNNYNWMADAVQNRNSLKIIQQPEHIMKKLLTILCITATLAFVANAEEGARPQEEERSQPGDESLAGKV